MEEGGIDPAMLQTESVPGHSSLHSRHTQTQKPIRPSLTVTESAPRCSSLCSRNARRVNPSRTVNSGTESAPRHSSLGSLQERVSQGHVHPSRTVSYKDRLPDPVIGHITDMMIRKDTKGHRRVPRADAVVQQNKNGNGDALAGGCEQIIST
ncbi:hypothetical protein DPMN_039514 [Dreissena polymorpha]|uniref:Uncharacterized protein n=1 Tax=Dreissena polymorpha TaxID=45954 RepID=A0A9D4HUB8_DREPO|nr:hypothetical protein DPMN_039514 [Dreissena polymorpha]